MNVATPLDDRAAPFCRRAGTTSIARVVSARPGDRSSAALSVTRALWHELVTELLSDDLGASRR